MFKSTTLRLTGWYLLILMIVSIVFSAFVFEVASNEVGLRLDHFQTGLQKSQDDSIALPIVGSNKLREQETSEARTSLSLQLLYINLGVLVLGGFGSYFLARRSIRPIEKAHNAQSRFTSDASHELRTPLAVMKTEIEVALRDDNATAKDLKSILSSNLEEVDNLTKLSEMLLNLSRLDNEKLKLDQIDISKIARHVVDGFNKPITRISLQSSEKLIAQGNETAIADLMKILIDNALQYSPDDSQVNINVSRQDQQVEFKIINSGHGINQEKLQHIFERFYRADESRTKSSKKSYGLGLALAKNIIDLHKGKIVASSAPEQDTTFSFYLPLSSNAQANIKT